MTRVFENKSVGKIARISLIIVVVVVIYGFFELYRAFIAGTDDQLAPLFGIAFIGGGAIALNSLLKDNRDQVQWFDVDMAANQGRLAVWKLTGSDIADISLDQLTDWQYKVKVARKNNHAHFLMATIPGHDRPVQFLIAPPGDLDPVFRTLAPEAYDDYESNTGRKTEDDEETDA